MLEFLITILHLKVLLQDKNLNLFYIVFLVFSSFQTLESYIHSSNYSEQHYHNKGTKPKRSNLNHSYLFKNPKFLHLLLIESLLVNKWKDILYFCFSHFAHIYIIDGVSSREWSNLFLLSLSLSLFFYFFLCFPLSFSFFPLLFYQITWRQTKSQQLQHSDQEELTSSSQGSTIGIVYHKSCFPYLDW